MRDSIVMGLPGLESPKNGLPFPVEVKFSMLCDVGVSFRMRPELVAALQIICMCVFIYVVCIFL